MTVGLQLIEDMRKREKKHITDNLFYYTKQHHRSMCHPILHGLMQSRTTYVLGMVIQCSKLTYTLLLAVYQTRLIEYHVLKTCTS